MLTISSESKGMHNKNTQIHQIEEEAADGAV
jgi:hypothetical protein